MAKTFKVDTSRRIADGVAKAFLALNLAPKGLHLLTTTGRKTGIPRSTPVIILEDEGRKWLVSPFGHVSWTYNARAAGKVTIARNGKTETLLAREVSAQQAAPILRKYFAQTPITRPYFDVGPDSSDHEFIAEAPKHPVFELLRQDPA